MAKNTKKSKKTKDVKASANPNLTREFVGGKMVITIGNRPPREVTVETLQQRKDNVANMVANRSTRFTTMIDSLTTKIAAEEDAEKKTRLETRLANMQSRQANLPTQQEIEDRLQGWIDSANASA